MDVKWQCQCGKMSGQLNRLSASSVNRVVCHCKFCQTYQHQLGHPENLDAHGGTEVFQMTPKDFVIEQGQQHLKALRLTSKGAIRFYAGCCNTPLVNTAANIGLPFAGVSRTCVPEFKEDATITRAIGDVRARVQGSGAAFNQLPKTSKRFARAMYLHAARLIAFWWLRGDAKRSTFRKPDGSPIVEPIRVKRSET